MMKDEESVSELGESQIFSRPLIFVKQNFHMKPWLKETLVI